MSASHPSPGHHPGRSPLDHAGGPALEPDRPPGAELPVVLTGADLTIDEVVCGITRR